MENIIVLSLVALVTIALIAAVVLYYVAQKFKVDEDPNIDIINAILPGANCGGCGFAGCRSLAEAIVKKGDMDGLFCPVGGAACAAEVASVLGIEPPKEEPRIAVITCNGSPQNAHTKGQYDSVHTCRFANYLFSGENGCPNRCLGHGDCENVCQFDAIHISEETHLPIVNEDKCVACGVCVKTCPRHIIELRNKGPKNRRIFVSCENTEKGVLARKNCDVACIGCGKCFKACPFEAITMKENLAYIDYRKCRLCRKCVSECPTGAIREINFPAANSHSPNLKQSE